MYEFKQIQSAGTAGNNEFLKIWVARYLPELGTISSDVRKHIEPRLRLSVTDESRQATYAHIRKYLTADCTQAAIDTQKLLLTAGLSPEFQELQNLSSRVYTVYKTLLEYYAQSFIFLPTLEYLHAIDSEVGKLQAAELVIPQFKQLMLTISPLLRELKAVYFSSINHHLIGFMTTHIHFTQQRILKRLNPYEYIWLAPYFQVLDELVCMPWVRICTFASTHPDISDSFFLVKKMLPKVTAISALIYQKALQTYPNHISYQGRIQSSTIRHSSIRDLNMFQSYIWLCVLEDSVTIIEKKLLPVCLQVFPLTNVKWELVIFAVQTIIETIQSQLSSSEQALFKQYAVPIEQLFSSVQPQKEQVAWLKRRLQESNHRGPTVSYLWKSH